MSLGKANCGVHIQLTSILHLGQPRLDGATYPRIDGELDEAKQVQEVVNCGLFTLNDLQIMGHGNQSSSPIGQTMCTYLISSALIAAFIFHTVLEARSDFEVE